MGRAASHAQEAPEASGYSEAVTTRLLPVLAAVGVLALSGCTGSDDGGSGSTSGSAPAGTSDAEGAAVETIDPVEPAADATDLSAPDLTLSVPAAWEVGDQSGDGLTQLMARGEEGGTRAAVQVVGVPTAETDTAAALDEARTLGQVRSETQVSLPRLSTTGPATLLDLEYTVEGQPAQSWVLVLEQGTSTYTVTFLAEPFDEALAREVLGTLRDA